MPYTFRKIYADLVADDGAVHVCYLTWVRFHRRWHGAAGVERYGPDGERTLHHATRLPDSVTADTPLEALPLALDLPGGTFRLEYAPQHGAWAPPDPVAGGHLRWSVILARGEARAFLPWAGVEVQGTGYVDFVEITRPTRLLGLRRLRWGRLHLPDRTVVFDHLETADGAPWTPARAWPGPGTTGTEVALEAGRGTVRVGGETWDLAPERVLHEGDPFDPVRVPGTLDRAVCRAVGGPHHEVRWAGRVTGPGGTGRGLWEEVTFGPEALARRGPR